MEKKKDPNHIPIEEFNRLMLGVEKFIEERGNPKFNIVWVSDMMLKRVQKDNDTWVCLEGQKSKGKSNTALLISLLIHRYSGVWVNTETGEKREEVPRLTPLPQPWLQTEVGFSFDKNLSFLDNAQQIREKYNLLPRFGCLVLDESIKNLLKYNFMQKAQQDLIRLSATERFQNKICLLCIPSFDELTSVFRRDRVQMRLYMYFRSTAQNSASCIMSLKNESRFSTDPWSQDYNSKLYDKLLERVNFGLRSREQILKTEKRLKGFVCDFEVPNIKHLSPKIWNIYQRLKEQNAAKEGADSEIDPQTIVYEKKIYNLKYGINALITWLKEKYPEITYKKIAEITTLTPAQISTIKSEMNKNLDAT